MPENPYESPVTTGNTPPTQKVSAGRIVAGIALLLLMIPASASAFFAVCFAAASFVDANRGGVGTGREPILTGVWMGGFAGVLVAGLMIWAAVTVLRRK